MTATVAGIVITKNEEHHIADCLEQLNWADELIVLDSFSDDRTIDVARRWGARVEQLVFSSFPRQRNAALGLSRSDWIFFVDADERATPELRDEVRRMTVDDTGYVGFWVPRRNIICGRWIRYGGWYPDYQLRLLRAGHATYDERREVHELVKLDGEAGHLEHTLIHYNYDRWSQFLEKQVRYAALDARAMFQAGIRPKPRNFVLQPLREIHRRYLQLRGYRDGTHGMLLALLLGYYTCVTYRNLFRMWHDAAL